MSEPLGASRGCGQYTATATSYRSKKSDHRQSVVVCWSNPLGPGQMLGARELEGKEIKKAIHPFGHPSLPPFNSVFAHISRASCGNFHGIELNYTCNRKYFAQYQ